MNSTGSGQKKPSTSDTDLLRDIKERVIRSLARREHSRYELQTKMKLKSYEDGMINIVLDELEAEALISDERFAEAYTYHRKSKGFGPIRIASELKERKVSEYLIAEYVHFEDDDWVVSAIYQREKKFGREKVTDFSSKAKQMRFLMQKGFTHDQISNAVDQVS